MKSRSATIGSWLYENLSSQAQFSSSASYASASQPTEMFQGSVISPFGQPDEELFPLDPPMHFQPQRAVVYSQPQLGSSSSYAVGSDSSAAMLPLLSSYDDAPSLQPPVVPTSLPPNPYNQPPF